MIGRLFGMLLLLAQFSFAATVASCAFTTFQAPKGYTFNVIGGLSDDGTVVGQLQNNSTFAMVGFIRSAGGKITTYSAPNSRMTYLMGRNAAGAIAGYYLDSHSHLHGFILQGSQFTQVDYPKASNTWLFGVNQLGTRAGSYNGGTITKGFIEANGKFTTLAYPGVSNTTPWAINDSGLVVGTYSNTPASPVNHGFLWQGKFTTLDYPNSRYGTVLTGIDNSGLIVGNHNSADRSFGFIYVNSTFKNIVYSGANYTITGGINNNGLISGQIFMTNGTSLGYTATCK